MEDFIVEKDGKQFIDVVKILPESLPSGKKIICRDLENGLVEISVDKHSARGGNSNPCVINRLIPINEELFLLFGLWSGDGLKIQDGVHKLFGFANTEITLLKKFLLLSENILSLNRTLFKLHASLPLEDANKKNNIEKWISEEFQIPKENFWKTQINPTRNFVHIDVRISSRLLGFTINILSEKINWIILADKNFCAAFLQGMIASEGNVHVRKEGRLGEIMIAAQDKKKRELIRKLLFSLRIIPSKDKEIPQNEGVLIHGIENFEKMGALFLCSLHPSKNREFIRGLNGFKMEQFKKGEGKILIIQEISKGINTSKKLSENLRRKQHAINFHLRSLEKEGLIRKASIDGRKIMWELTENEIKTF